MAMSFRRSPVFSAAFLDRPAAELEMTVLDFETTGVVPGWPVEPWQLGMVAFCGGRVVPESVYESLIRIGDRPFSRHAPGRHEFCRDALRVASTFPLLWPALQPRLVGRPLVAHQAGTERSVLRRLVPLHTLGPWVDTLRLTRRAYPGLASGGLSDVLGVLGLHDRAVALCPNRPFHDAVFDAVACGVLLEHVLAQPAWQGASLRQLLGS